MLIYDVLASLWDAPATDTEVARTVRERLALRQAQGDTADAAVSRNQVDQHLRLLRTTGHVATKNVAGAPAYVLTEAGSTLLAQLASRIEMETHTHVSL